MSAGQPPLEVLRAEGARLSDQLPGRVHLLPDVPQQHPPAPAHLAGNKRRPRNTVPSSRPPPQAANPRDNRLGGPAPPSDGGQLADVLVPLVLAVSAPAEGLGSCETRPVTACSATGCDRPSQHHRSSDAHWNSFVRGTRQRASLLKLADTTVLGQSRLTHVGQQLRLTAEGHQDASTSRVLLRMHMTVDLSVLDAWAFTIARFFRSGRARSCLSANAECA